MTGKRVATTDLNHDNWDQDEEPEDRGTFRTAPENELKTRIIKKARRKVVDGMESKSVFSGFSGFTKITQPTKNLSASPFAFLSELPAAVVTTSSTNPTFSFDGSQKVIKTTESEINTVEKNVPCEGLEEEKKSADYCAKLKSLNNAVSGWIKQHVDNNPLCILTPIFKDYEKFLAEIYTENNSNPAFSTAVTNSVTKSSFASLDGGFKPKAVDLNPKKESIANTYIFPTTVSSKAPTTLTSNMFDGISNSSSIPSKENGFRFNLNKADEKNISPAFTDKKNVAFDLKPVCAATSFTVDHQHSAVAFSTSNVNAGENNDEDQPPKVQFKQVVEEDSIYSKKCKVFVKKDGNYVDRGVGTLYLKPIKNTEKTQLLVRADTNLGNILVNIILSSVIPSQRMGKNNVMMMCLPTPDIEKPTSLLLRVKTSEDADELLKTIDKYKK